MYLEKKIHEEKLIWERKKSLHLLKINYYKKIESWFPDKGAFVELGSGPGWTKEINPEIITTDIFPLPWLDITMSASELCFKNDSIDILFGIDILHHLRYPFTFFEEAGRVLKQNGRLLLIEPYVSTGSWISWNMLHNEKCSMKESLSKPVPFLKENNGRATLWFIRHLSAIKHKLPPLTLENISFFDIFYYPLTAGLRSWDLMPSCIAPFALRLDRYIGKLIGKSFGYRLMIVLKK